MDNACHGATNGTTQEWHRRNPWMAQPMIYDATLRSRNTRRNPWVAEPQHIGGETHGASQG
eukprot:6412269-Pyramimonas_sp.AAC.1